MRALLFVMIQCTALSPLWAQKPKLYVFLPSTIRPYAMERTLQTACPELEVRVFGRHREFLRSVTADQPHGVLSLEPVILKSEFNSYQKVFAGLKDNQHKVPYALLSVDRELQPTSLDGVSIGVVDLLGRQQMKGFLSKMLSGAEPKIKPVTKFEDLLSLLQVREANAIFIPEAMWNSYYRKRSKMDLVLNRLDDAKVGLAVLALRNPKSDAGKKITAVFKRLDEKANATLGVDRWEAP